MRWPFVVFWVVCAVLVVLVGPRRLFAAKRSLGNRLFPFLVVALPVVWLWDRFVEGRASSPVGPILVAFLVAVPLVTVFFYLERRRRLSRWEQLRVRSLITRSSPKGCGFGQNQGTVEAFLDSLMSLSDGDRTSVVAAARSRGIKSLALGAAGGRRYDKVVEAIAKAGSDAERAEARWAAADALREPASAPVVAASSTVDLEIIDLQALAQNAAEALVVREDLDEASFALVVSPFLDVLGGRVDYLLPDEGA